MSKFTILRAAVLCGLAGVLLATAGPAQTLRTQPQPKPQPRGDSLPNRNQPFTPKFEALAETRLLMEGMANPNYRSLHRLLKNKPADKKE